MKRNFYFRSSFIESIEPNTVNCIREGSILKKRNMKMSLIYYKQFKFELDENIDRKSVIVLSLLHR